MNSNQELKTIFADLAALSECYSLLSEIHDIAEVSNCQLPSCQPLHSVLNKHFSEIIQKAASFGFVD